MLLVLLGILLNFSAGQIQSGYEGQVITREFSQEANANAIANEASISNVDSANVINIAAPPPKMQYGISHQIIQLKPIITDVSAQTITHNTRIIPTELEKTLHAGGFTNVFETAVSAPDQLNMEQKVIKLKPKISNVFVRTIGESTEEGNQGVAGRTHIREIKEAKLYPGKSTNLISIAAPFPKIQLGTQHESIKLKPKISNVFSQSISENTQEANQDIASRSSMDGLHHEESVNVINVAPFPKIQLNMEQDAIKLKPKKLDVFSKIISESPDEGNQDTARGANVDGNHHEEPVNVFNVAVPLPKVRFDLEQDASRLKPKNSNVFKVISESTDAGNQDTARNANVDGIRHEGSVNVFKIAAPLPEVQFNTEQGAVELKPKISNVFSQTISDSAQEANQNLASQSSMNGLPQLVKVVSVASPLPNVKLNMKRDFINFTPQTLNGFSHSEITHGENQQTAGGTFIQGIDGANFHTGKSTNMINIAAPLPRIQHVLKPKMSNMVFHSINGITQGANREIIF